MWGGKLSWGGMRLRQPYSPLASYTAPVEPGRLATVVFGIGLVALCFFAAQIALGLLAVPHAEDGAGYSRPQIAAYLAGFLAPALLLALWVRRCHGQPPASLLGPLPLAGRQFSRALTALALLAAVLLVLPPWPIAAELERVNPLLPWLFWLAPMALLILIQTAAEELLFRGYLLQQIAARWQSPWAWMVAPSVLFGLLHIPNGTSSAESAVIAIWITGFALISSDLVARSGTLAPSIALHWANNLVALLLNGERGAPFERLALLVWPNDDAGLAAMSVADVLSPLGLIAIFIAFLPVIVCWLAVRLAIRR